MITVWILVGVVSAGSSSVPPSHERFYDEPSCEAAKKASEEVARNSSLRCVRVLVVK